MLFEGKRWDKAAIAEFHRPWLELQATGSSVHIGEFGCFNQTPNDSALRRFKDLLGLFNEFGWGYALWNFECAFGIVNRGRPGTVYETVQGYQVDRELLELLRPKQA